MSSSWVPKRSLAEVDAMICAPGTTHELEMRVIDGRVQRVYKNLWPSLRHFWLWASREYAVRTYLVFEEQRYTYREVFEQSHRAAVVFRELYGVQKGDRVVICSKNCAGFVIAFWACHLLGAVSVFVNPWLPAEQIVRCFIQVQCKLGVVDPASASALERHTETIIRQAGTAGFLVFDDHQNLGRWDGIKPWGEAMSAYSEKEELDDPMMVPEDNASIIFTSGTTGSPKGVLSTQRMFLTNILNPAVLITVPLFHATGTTGMMMVGTAGGAKIVLIRRWDAEEGARLLREEKIRMTGGVPSIASDLAASSAVGYPLERLFFGGAAPPDWLTREFQEKFPHTVLSQGYGATETNAAVVGNAGEDFITRPTSAFVQIFRSLDDQGAAVPIGELGEIWVRGPNVMKGYWNDPVATANALTLDGWLKTGDVGCIDQEGFVYIRDRIKDLIIRGGENIDSVSVENAVAADSRLLEAAAVGVPDRRLGELPAVVVSVKPNYCGKIKEFRAEAHVVRRLPRFAVPVMVLLKNEPLPRNAAGKIVKNVLRPLAKAEWEQRCAADQQRAKL
ncbi:hypothetical protein EWM64_g5401 [Hericium alpestre]|uniref:AMP-dependent synthetase/ligase domain-containing protein n=1 Tax=Hericium alpestre TaxID=135208 RepID=A0A4Y9ZUY6_9AGAM|nr:hypothetical protein EWM64_g5401 [Hericium alpestre]